MSGRIGRAIVCSAAVAALTALAGTAEAQTPPVDLPKFNPSAAGDRFFGVPSPYAAGDLTFHAMTLIDYAREPLILTRDESGEDIGAIVSDQLFLHVGLNFSIISRFAINLDMPFALLSAGDAPAGGGLEFAEPSGASLADLRLGLRVRILGEYHDAFQLGAGGYIWVPTGSDTSYVTDGSVRGQPQVLVGGRADRFIYSVMVGPSFRGNTDIGGGVKLGHQMNWGLGAGVLLLDERSLQLGLESTGGVDVENPDGRSTNGELLAGAKWRFIPFLEAGVAAGPGLTTGIGTPAVRVVAQFAYTPEIEAAKTDRDGDGIFDDVDACPDTPGVKSEDPAQNGCPPVEKREQDRDKDGIFDGKDACPDDPGPPNADPKKNGCPERDSDADGVVDDVDACPNEAGVPNEDPKKNGCPVRDKDGDTIADEVDACPEIPGVKTDDPKTNGCPPDTDGDGFRDDQDACPQEKGVDSPDPTKRGCPRLVRVTDKEILILEQVQFDTGKATIKAVSNPLLDAVAEVLKEHPEITKLEVQGHTDNRGSKQLNAKLSDDRAKSVREALVKRGIDGARMSFKGYGMDVPIGDNKTDAGRQQNRRVQFIVTEKAEKKPAAPKP